MQPSPPSTCPARVKVEVVTTLGDTCLERTLADIPEQPLPIRTPFGLGMVEVRAYVPVRGALPRPIVERRVLAFGGVSLALHCAVLVAAFRQPALPPPLTAGASRPRLVANHTTATRALRAPEITTSTHDADRAELQPFVQVGDARQQVAYSEIPASQIIGSQPQMITASTPQPSLDHKRQTGEVAARHFDPCADGDCGLIPTTRFQTTSSGRHAGDAYRMPTRRTLAMSVVDCSPEGGCNTVSGTDEGDLRAEIGHHVAELEACFDGNPDPTASIDAHVDDAGVVHIAAHDTRATSACIAGVVAKLKFSAGERDVTLAFTAPLS